MEDYKKKFMQLCKGKECQMIEQCKKDKKELVFSTEIRDEKGVSIVKTFAPSAQEAGNQAVTLLEESYAD